MKYKYNFIDMNGDIISTNNLLDIKSDLRKWERLSWEKLNNFMPIGKLTKEERDFLNKWELYPSVFNVGCLHHIKMVYLPEFFYNNVLKLKGGLKK